MTISNAQRTTAGAHFADQSLAFLSRCMARLIFTPGLVLIWAFFLFAHPSVHAQSLTPARLERIAFEQKLGAQVSPGLSFRDEEGRDVKLLEYFGRRPVILVLGYYECPMLCTLTLNGMVEALEDVRWTMGNQFYVVNVSINPAETPQLAAAKKKTYLKRYGRVGAEQGWHFLTGAQPAIQRLADEVGFQYAYDPAVKQYAHPAGIVILTPERQVAKYLFGVTFSPAELSAALQAASRRQIGSRIQQLALLCFHYSPIKGRYGPAIMLVVRLLGAATLIGLGWLLLSGCRSEPTPSAGGAPIPPPGAAPDSPGFSALPGKVPGTPASTMPAATSPVRADLTGG